MHHLAAGACSSSLLNDVGAASPLLTLLPVGVVTVLLHAGCGLAAVWVAGLELASGHIPLVDIPQGTGPADCTG
jgi:hypothetical protein